MRYVVCNPETKRPRGTAWQTKHLSEEEIHARKRANPNLVYGILLGVPSGVVDVEADSAAAEKQRKELLAGIRTPGWNSKRGRHNLFRYDPRFDRLKSVIKLDGEKPGDQAGLEFRLGGSASQQSICPDSVVDGVQRIWDPSPQECEIAALPETVIEMLLQHQKKPKADYEVDPLFAECGRELQAARVEKLKSYLTRHNLTPQVVEQSDGRITLTLPRCPFKPVGHDNGDCHVTVWPSGVYAFHCFHAKDHERTWDDVEVALGDRLYPVIKIGPKLYETVAQSIAALAADPTVYQRGPLVEVVPPTPQPAQARRERCRQAARNSLSYPDDPFVGLCSLRAARQTLRQVGSLEARHRHRECVECQRRSPSPFPR